MKNLLFYVALFICLNANAQWVQTNGPIKGSISCQDTLGNRIYVGTTKGEVFMSSDSGATWTANDPLSMPSNISINAIKAVASRVIIGTSLGMYYSTDFGYTWSSVGGVAGAVLGGDVYSIAVSGTKIFAGADAGVCVSTDGGVTWTEKVIPSTPSTCNTYVVGFCDTVLFAWTVFSGTFRSYNYGNTWSAVTGIGGSSVTCITSSGSTTYLSTLSDVFRSTDYGNTWVSITAGLAPWIKWVSAENNNVYAATEGGGLFRSSNFGATWTAITNGIETVNLYSVISDGNRILAGADNGFYVSNDTANTWINSSVGIGTADVNGLTSTPDGIFAGVSIGGIHRSTDHGNAWHSKSSGLPLGATTSVYYLESMDTILFSIGSGATGLMRSFDGGETWGSISAGLSSAGALISVTSEGSDLYLCAVNGLYLSTNLGNTWTLINNSSFQRVIFNGPVMIASTTASLFRSLDNGVTFTSINSGISFNYIYSIAVGGGAVYVGGDALFSSGNIFRTFDNGDNWTNLDNSNGLPVSTAIFNYALAADDSYVYAYLGDSHIYTSIDQGNTWIITDSCSSLMNRMIIVPPYIYGATVNGVWRGPAIAGVWPGDTDNDSLVSPADLLQVGLFYGATGASRSGISNSWQEFASLNWDSVQINGSNIHHVDCNGDGIINSNDTLAINLNMSMVHAIQPNENAGPRIASNLYFTTAQSSYNVGDWVDVEVWAGDSLNPVSNLYGLAFDISYDPSVVQLGTESISVGPSWIGTPGSNMIKIGSINSSASLASVALTRIDHANNSGYGKIAQFRFQVKSVIPITTTAVFNLNGYVANDADGDALMFSSVAHSILINSGILSAPELVGNAFSLDVFPNPVSNSTQILYQVSEQSDVTLEVFDVYGRKVLSYLFGGQSKGKYAYPLNLNQKENAAGVYFVKISVGGSSIVKRITLTKP